MLIGYAKSFDEDITLRKQIKALNEARCKKVIKDKQNTNGRQSSKLVDMLGNLNKGDTLVVWRLDRLADSLKDLIDIVTQIHDRKANLKSLSENFDINAKSAETILPIFKLCSDFQYELIRQRTLHGLKLARESGRIGGRPSKLSDAQVRKAKTMLDKRKATKTEVATHFNISRSTLNRALNSHMTQ